MYKRRLIPVLFLKDGWMVRSENFSLHQFLGDPVHHVRRMVNWDVDELIIINIGKDDNIEHHRSDYLNKPVNNLIELLNILAFECNIPLTFGGNINSLDDIISRIRNGADKVTLNRMLLEKSNIVSEAVNILGSQAIIASIDYRIVDEQAYVFSHNGKKNTGIQLDNFVKKSRDLGVGEIFLNCIDRDGCANGYDIDTIEKISSLIDIPVIACGGAGMNNHFLKCFERTNNNVALAAGNFFHFKENAYPNVKQYLHSFAKNIRYIGA
jgi:cyclase